LGSGRRLGFHPPASNYVKFNLDWRFSKGTFPFATDDTGWEWVSTPHTYRKQFRHHIYSHG